MNKRESIIQQIVQVADKNYPESEVYPYGSRARKKVNTNSDWDLLILLKEDNVPFELETGVMDNYYDLELKIGEVFSPLVYAKSDWNDNYSIIPRYDNIQKEGVKLK
ncbi:MAG: putative nucleotidyltransferase [Cyclobacteriaceae bacterium]|jgi:predicted nucleotidyltransferase